MTTKKEAPVDDRVQAILPLAAEILARPDVIRACSSGEVAFRERVTRA
jgi:hypothetical protein